MSQLKLKFKKIWKTYKKNPQKNPPTSPPPYVPPPLLKEKEREIEKNKSNEEFIKTFLLMNKDKLHAANESTDQKNKKIIKDIIDPTPGLFVDDQLKPNEQNFQNTTGNVFNLPPQVQQQLNEAVFKKIIKTLQFNQLHQKLFQILI